MTAAANGQPADDVRLTREGRHQLATRARHLSNDVIPSLRALVDGRDRDDLVQLEYQRATSELERIRNVLASAETTEALADDPDIVELGERVTVRLASGHVESYVLVHHSEATVGSHRVSVDSPLGTALLGRRIGDRVDVPAPGGPYRCVIESATRPDPPWSTNGLRGPATGEPPHRR